MDRKRICAMQFLCLLHVVAMVAGYRDFQKRIPNGEIVPHPCKTSYIWQGVGHDNMLGSDARNAFGLDFKNNGLIWNEVICKQDSDNDGKTNGEELGDPNCAWAQGQMPEYSVGLSHPGICEPIDSENCKNTTGFVECDALEFDYPVLNDPETFNYTVTIPKTAVPERETSYTCMNFELPIDRVYHLVASKPVIDEYDVMHHLIDFGCPGVENDTELSSPLNTPYTCNMAVDKKCSDIISLWSVGGTGNCFHDDMGFLIGGTAGYKYAAFQIHWNNPQLRGDYTDASGMSLYLTPKLRPNNAGVLMIGQFAIEIPHSKESYDVTGSCMPECTSKWTSSIFVTASVNHMHYLGKSQVSELIRDGERVQLLAEDRTFSYDSPVIYDHKEEIEVKPGDEVKTTCTYNSTSRTSVTRFGDGTSDEMCFAFLLFYPKERLFNWVCAQSRKIPSCMRAEGVVHGCDTKLFYIPSHPQMVALYEKLSSKCSISHCKPDCLEYVKRVKMNPCFSGDINLELREYTYFLKDEKRSNLLMFYAMFDSCDVEIAKEACEDKQTSGGSWFPASISLCLWMAFVLFYI